MSPANDHGQDNWNSICVYGRREYVRTHSWPEIFGMFLVRVVVYKFDTRRIYIYSEALRGGGDDEVVVDYFHLTIFSA